MRLLKMIACILVTLLGVMPSHAEKRVALVIGNGAYERADRLPNPVTDARRMRDALSKLGFAVVYGENLAKQPLERTIGRFADTVQDADVALVYFAGHGATFGDVPYIVPVDAQFSSLREIPYELVPVETLIGELRQAKGLRIAILDACRDDAAERELKRTTARGGETTRGLARVKNPEGLILAYATQYLSTAADGGPNGDSPFTAALLNNIATPGLDVKDLFFKVGREVTATTQGKQRPEISVSFYEPYALVSAPPVATTTPPTVSSPPDPAAQAWAAGVKDTTSIAVLEEFRRQYPNSVFASFAAARIDELKKQQTALVAPLVVPAVPPRQDPPLPAVVAPPITPPVATAPCGGPVTVSFSSRCAAPLTEAQERALKPKDAFMECAQCPEMVVVPAGSFTMGSPSNEKQHFGNEGPQHRVTLGRGFAVGRFAVTFDEWDACVADGGCGNYRPADQGWGRGRRPVINVSWYDAEAYLAWLSRKTGKSYRLLSEAEREYVTRAGTTTPFWWGSSISPRQANYDGGGGLNGENRQRTVPVDSFSANPWGLYQVHGNVWEWTEDCWHPDYNGAPTNGSAWTDSACGNHVLRGGSALVNPRNLRAALRIFSSIGSQSKDFGFRVGRTLIAP